MPSTTDLDGTVKGAAKFAQIGQDAMEKIIDAVLDGATVDQRHAVLFWELNMGWGNLFDALVAKRGGWNFPAYYFSTTPDVTQHDWFMHSKLQSIKDLHLMDSISIPGFAHLPSTMPSDLLEDRPSMPALNKLVAVETPKAGPGDEKVHVLSMPETIIKTWYQHPTCSESLNWIRRLRSVFFYVFVVF